jgi:hypothetical protein
MKQFQQWGRAVIDNVYWATMVRVCPVHKVDEFRVVYVADESSESINRLESNFRQALAELAAAGDAFRATVTREIQILGILAVTSPYVAPGARAYVTPGSAITLAPPRVLAAQLVWAAEFVACNRARLLPPVCRQTARETQLRFLDCFDDAIRWRAMLDES